MQDILDADAEMQPDEAAWDDLGTPTIADDDVITVSDSGIDENSASEPPAQWTARPLEPEHDEDEKKYVERYRDVDVDRLIDQFGLSVKKNFGIKNKYAAVQQVDDLGLTENLNNPLVLDDEELMPADGEESAAASVPDEDRTDESE